MKPLGAGEARAVFLFGKSIEGGEGMLVPMERIEKAIYLLRGQKVMLDRDLAELYGVETRVLNQAVRRNIRVRHRHAFQRSEQPRRYPAHLVCIICKNYLKMITFANNTYMVRNVF
jgi:hypothetical protein